jgi:predicted metal-dependent hydrolase
MSKTYHVNYGSKVINFNLFYAERKSLGIRVFPDGDIKVIAPLKSQLGDIKQKVITKASWIIKHQNELKKYNPKTPKRKYVNGETHLYLGRHYILSFIKTQKNETTNFVKLLNGKMLVYSNINSLKNIEILIEGFYEKRSLFVFNELFESSKERIKNVVPRTSKKQIETAYLSINHFKNKWGTCTKSGKISLNLELIRAPKVCIEYVIIHELCHLIHFNHKKSFYQLLEVFMPDWRRWKEKLELIMA